MGVPMSAKMIELSNLISAMVQTVEYECPACGDYLELLDCDGPPSSDQWVCLGCDIAYPHSQFPLPKGYAQASNALEREREREWEYKLECEKLEKWNKWATGV